MTIDSHLSDMLTGEPQELRIATAATRLAIAFSDEADLPARYQKSSTRKRGKVRPEAQVEKRFRVNVKAWSFTLETMLAKLDTSQAWRFADLCPQADKPISKLTESKDLCDFFDYLALRRDQEMCGPEELGCLAMLLSAFQREIEKRIREGEPSSLPLVP